LSSGSVGDIEIIHLAICEIDALVHVNGIEIPWFGVDDVEHLLLGDVKEGFEEDLILISDLQRDRADHIIDKKVVVSRSKDEGSRRTTPGDDGETTLAADLGHAAEM